MPRKKVSSFLHFFHLVTLETINKSQRSDNEIIFQLVEGSRNFLLRTTNILCRYRSIKFQLRMKLLSSVRKESAIRELFAVVMSHSTPAWSSSLTDAGSWWDISFHFTFAICFSIRAQLSPSHDMMKFLRSNSTDSSKHKTQKYFIRLAYFSVHDQASFHIFSPLRKVFFITSHIQRQTTKNNNRSWKESREKKTVISTPCRVCCRVNWELNLIGGNVFSNFDFSS